MTDQEYLNLCEMVAAKTTVTDPAWNEYDLVASEMARKGLKGVIGDPLPNLISATCEALIQADHEAFQERVRLSAYALAMGEL